MVKEVKTNSYETLKALFYSGKVKPSLNKILVEIEKTPDDYDLILLACQCLVRTKDYDQLSDMADAAIKLDENNSNGYYYKGLALQNNKGQEQEALVNFNKALEFEPENPIYLKGKATTHLSLYTDYQLPLQFAEKHRVKGADSLAKVVSIVEAKEDATYLDLFTIGEVSTILERNLDAKKYYIQAVNAYEKADEVDQNSNTFKDIIKAQKACVKLMEKFTE